MAGNHHTGIELFSYEITITPRGGLRAEHILTLDNLPHSSAEEFQQKLRTALLNLGIDLAQKVLTHKLKNG